MKKRGLSQSLWVRDRFLMDQTMKTFKLKSSQSLWVRDRFLIVRYGENPAMAESQSLWVRDRFLIQTKTAKCLIYAVAIPLGQGQVFN